MKTSALHQKVRRTIRRHRLIPPGGRVLVGLSGGSDSVALTLLLLDLARHGDFEVVALAHLNHRLRAAADHDETFCRAFAARLNLELVTETRDISGIAADRGWSIEDAARRCRYAFLDEAAGSTGAQLVAVGHTEDDQAETFLLKLMRGAGLAGLGGVYPRKGRVIRPLLDSSRAELRSFLLSRGESWVDDESNEDVANPRNRIRHRVLPELEHALGGNARPNLARAASLAREDAEWLDELAAESWPAVTTEGPGGVEIDAGRAAALPVPLARRVVLRALRVVADGREVSRDHVDGVIAVIAGETGGIDVPGGRVELRAGKAVLIQQKAD